VCADSSFLPPLGYSVLGTSRHIAIGPTAVVSLLLGTLLKKHVDPESAPNRYLKLAFTATFFAGSCRWAWASSGVPGVLPSLLLYVLDSFPNCFGHFLCSCSDGHGRPQVCRGY